MEISIKNIKTKNNIVQCCQLKWSNSWLFIIDASKGNIVCASIDIEALDRINIPAAQITPKVGESVNSIEEFEKKKITGINKNAEKLGIKIGMPVYDVIDLLN